MLVLLDSRDLIELLERQTPCDLPTFGSRLSEGAHELCLSVTAVRELAAPLVQATGNTAITRQLNDLETLPLRYVAEGRVVPLELAEAVRARNENRPFSTIDPFTTRFDDAIQVAGPAPTRFFLNYSLAGFSAHEK